MPEMSRHQLHENLAHEAGLARAGNAGNGGQHTKWDLEVKVAHVVVRDALKLQMSFRASHRAERRVSLVKKIARGMRFRDFR